jgi:hypothetical protein
MCMMHNRACAPHVCRAILFLVRAQHARTSFGLHRCIENVIRGYSMGCVCGGGIRLDKCNENKANFDDDLIHCINNQKNMLAFFLNSVPHELHQSIPEQR